MMEDSKSLLNILSSVMEEYLNRRTDDFKKNLITGLSVGFSRVLTVLVIALLLLIVLGVFAIAFIILIGEAVGSLSGGAFIVGGIYLTGVAILFFLRKRMFLNMFTNLFTDMIDTDVPSSKWKTLLMIIVRNLRNTIDG